MRGEFLLQFFALGNAVLERHEGIERLAFDVVRHGRDGGFGDFGVAHQRALHFRRADAMAGDVHHVIYAAEQPVITIGIHAAAVTGEIHVLERREIGVHEAMMVAPRRAHDAGPRFFDAELAALVQLAFGAIVAQDHRLHAEESAAGAAGFERVRAGQGGDEMSAGLGLPPGIHDGAALAADVLVIPQPRLGIDRFADGAEDAQRAEIIFRRPFIAEPDECANRGGRGVKGIHLELLDNFPEASGVGISGHALEHQRGAAVAKRAVNDVAVTRHPADVGGAEINVALVDVENVFVRERAPEQITGSAMDDAFRFAGRAARVEDEQIILRVQFFRRTFRRRLRHQVVIPHVADGNDVARFVRALDHDDVLDAWRMFQRRVGEFLELNVFARPQRDVGGDEQLAFGIVDAPGQRVRAEAAEDHRMNRADARTAKHRDGGFGNHRHVNRHAVAFLDAERFQDVREFADLRVQFRVGDALHVLFRLTLPDDGGLVAARFEVAIQAVDGEIELAVFKPGVLDLPRVRVPSIF